MKNTGSWSRATWLVACTTLASCGGGGGDPPAPNRPPEGTGVNPASLITNEDVLIGAQITAIDPDGDPITFSKTTDPEHGTLSVSGAGAVSYTPAANYNGTDQFVVRVADSRGASTNITVNVLVNAVNDAPTISTAALTFVEDTQGQSAAIFTDVEGDAITTTVVQAPAHGTIDNINAASAVLLTPAANYSGADTFILTATDSHGASTNATVTMNVTPVNDAPVATDDKFLLAAASGSLNVLANDVDIDEDALTVTIVTAPTVGNATVVGNQINLQAPAGYAGPATIAYRISDPSGATSSAVARVVVGEAPKLVFRAGRYVYYYDGFTTQTLNPTSSHESYGFVVSDNGQRVVYSERYTQSDNGSLFLADLTQLPSRSRVYQQPATPAGGVKYAISRDGSYLLVGDSTLNDHGIAAQYGYLTRLSDGVQANIVAPPASGSPFFPAQAGVFNPVTDEFYFQTRVADLPSPMTNPQAFNTLFAGSITSPLITQIGANYPKNNGSGSGIGIRVTADGHNVVHAALNYSTNVASLLVNNRVTNTETNLYRAFAAFEFPAPNEFDMSQNGSNVCFRVNSVGAPSSSGPGRFWIASPASPGSATAVTPVADFNFDCHFAADNKTLAYFSAASGQPAEVFTVDTTNPNVVTRLREALTAGQTADYFFLARKNSTALVGVSTASAAPVFYRADASAPGTSVNVGSPGITGTNPQYSLDDSGNWLAYMKDVPNPAGGTPLKELHILSTRAANFDLTIGIAEGTYQFVPQQ